MTLAPISQVPDGAEVGIVKHSPEDEQSRKGSKFTCRPAKPTTLALGSDLND